MTSKTRGKGNTKEGKKDARQRNALDILQEKEQIPTSLTDQERKGVGRKLYIGSISESSLYRTGYWPLSSLDYKLLGPIVLHDNLLPGDSKPQAF